MTKEEFITRFTDATTGELDPVKLIELRTEVMADYDSFNDANTVLATANTTITANEERIKQLEETNWKMYSFFGLPSNENGKPVDPSGNPVPPVTTPATETPVVETPSIEDITAGLLGRETN